MHEAELALADLASHQDQVFSMAQAVELGVSRFTVRRRVEAHRFLPVGTHTFRFTGTTLTWRAEARAGLLDLGSDARLAGRAAAHVLDLDGFAEGPLTFLVPRRQRGRTTLGEVRSTADLPRIDCAEAAGFPCTSATRTIIDLPRDANEREVANAIDSAMRMGLTSPEFLLQRFTSLRRSGLPGVRMLEQLLSSAGVQSWLEREFLRLVRVAGLPEPAIQRTYRRGTQVVARVDFDFAPLPVVVEVGGVKGYLTRQERRRQELRRNQLQLMGKIVYFFPFEEVTEEPGRVIATLREALGAPGAA